MTTAEPIEPAGGRALRIVVALALTAAAIRLVSLQWLHPLQWDEIEFFRASRWIAEGRVPFRDFWEHHTPLTWFVFAPVAALTKSPGVEAILAIRWAQVVVWIATFWLANVWMRGAGLGALARWSALALAVSSSIFMLPATEYRVDSVACALYVAALVLLQRGSRRGMALGGAVLVLVGFANLRFAPLAVVTLLLLPIVDPRERTWGGNRAGYVAWAGAIATLIASLMYFLATRSLEPFYRQVLIENLLASDAVGVPGAFLHRILIPFGVRLLSPSDPFELTGIDAGGVAITLLGVAGIALALTRWHAPDHVFFIALLQIANLVVIATMKFVYNYHLLLAIVLMLPLIAALLERVRWRAVVVALVAVAWCTGSFAALFRGKELDRAYQDLIMREVYARTVSGDTVWSGIPWALQREPAYELWFLPELARVLVREGLRDPYALEEIVRKPPAAVIFDHNALVWTATLQRELAPYFIRHYIPVWRNLWMPGMNGVVRPGSTREWIVPRTGDYAIYSSPELTRHAWFRDPLLVATHHGEEAARFTTELPPVASPAVFEWLVDGAPVPANERIVLRKGSRVTAVNRGSEAVAVLLYAGNDRVLFRQPPPGVTLEAETRRRVHVPRLGAAIR